MAALADAPEPPVPSAPAPTPVPAAADQEQTRDDKQSKTSEEPVQRALSSHTCATTAANTSASIVVDDNDNELDSLNNAISVVIIKNVNDIDQGGESGDSNSSQSINIIAGGSNQIVAGREKSVANMSDGDSDGSNGSCQAMCRNGKYCPECTTRRPPSGGSIMRVSDSIIITKKHMLQDQEASTSGQAIHYGSSKTGGNLAIGSSRYPFMSQDDNIQSELFETTHPIISDSRHFEIIWSNLSYRIEPKWYKKIDFLDRLFSHFIPASTIDNHSSATSTVSSSAGMNDDQHQMHAATSTNCADSISNGIKPKAANEAIEIFTNLNGTIKSGQLTAILGPSGK